MYMEKEIKINQEDGIFFLDMVYSALSPTRDFKPKRKPYYELVKDIESDNYKRFTFIYMTLRHVLNDREQYVLDETYRINKQNISTREIAESLKITINRVVQIRNKANRKLSRKIVDLIKI